MRSVCKVCGGWVEWKKEPGTGKWQCHNEGTDADHWDMCSQRRMAAIKRTGVPFKGKRGDEQIEGYHTPLKRSGEQLIRTAHKPVRGRLYKPSGECAECVAPWEVCTWPCPDAINKGVA